MNIICCFNSCKLNRAVDHMISGVDDIQNPIERSSVIQQTLNDQWSRIFAQNVQNEHSNRKSLAQKIDQVLIHLPVGISAGSLVIESIRAVQNSLRIIRQECSRPLFKEHFGLAHDARIEEVQLMFRAETNKFVFLIRFAGGQAIACYEPDDVNVSQIVDRPSQDIIPLPLEENTFRMNANGHQYHQALSPPTIRAKAREEAEAVDFHLNGIEVARDHLSKKIRAVLEDHIQPVVYKKQIIEQVKADAVVYMQEAIDHLYQDLAQDEEFRAAFSLMGNEQVRKIEVLGDETHNHGKCPILISFTNGKRIVYKPRSLVAEWAICSIREGLFRDAGLQTYTVINKGHYGYVQYLQNLPDRNIFETVGDVERYLESFIRMDRLLQPLRASDFHSANVITEDRRPHLIDTEVVMGPVARPTSLVTTDFQSAWVYHEDTYNRIWVTPELAGNLGVEAPNGLIADDEFYERFGKSIEHLRAQPQEMQRLQERIEHVKKDLSSTRHRIVAIPTQNLVNFLRMIPEIGFQKFLAQLEEDLPEHALQFIEGNRDAIRHQFESDVLHNDVPIFYYDPVREECYYKDILIGRKIAQQAVIPPFIAPGELDVLNIEPS